MQTWGSRGDVAPFVALAGGLRSAGHDVTLAVTTSARDVYAETALDPGVELRRVGSAMSDPPVRELQRLVRTRDRIKQLELLNELYFDPVLEELYEASTALCAENDIVIGHFWLHPLLTAATLHGVPRVVVHMCPLGVPSRHVPALGPSLGPWMNDLVRRLGDHLMRKRLFGSADALRAREGLPPIASLQRELFVSSELTLIAVSPLLCPREPDWGEHIEVCGFLDAQRREPARSTRDDLEEFAAAGEPPVYFTFGSCDVFFAEENVALFLGAVDKLGGRAIIQSSRPDAFAGHDASRIRIVETAAHERVFPRCRLVVHHGGAGTTQAALRAGKPAVVVEHGFDQAYWGRTLVGAGVSPRLLHRRSITPAKLARAVEAGLRTRTPTRNAERIGTALSAEDGVGTAVDVIGRRFAAAPPAD